MKKYFTDLYYVGVYRSNGFVRFSGGDTLCFSQQADNIIEFLDKTKAVGERLTNVYGGTLLQERVFYEDGAPNPRVV